MPNRCKRPCAHPGCPELTSGTRCDRHAAEHAQAKQDRRGTAAERGYDHRWRKAREAHLKRNPLCVVCLNEGRTTAATVVDHKIPHRGDPKLFWNRALWQSMCETHHNKKTAAGQ